jgi:superfamily II RNA helicase
MVYICQETYPTQNETLYGDYFTKFPYELSDFQKYAIEAIVQGHHVITSAPTGSGKTLSAEFAIQHLLAQGKRVFYTTPIKALSNQKYYEFTNRYPDIRFGLLTGDIKTNPDADVVIMTAEILTNMLFLSTTETKDEFPAAAVVMDEVHYINDESRGHTWEQTILLLPPHVQMIMLSATLDEPHKFAEWIETCKPAYTPPKMVYLASTNHRIVPLYHYSYLAMQESSYKNVGDKQIAQFIRQTANRLVKIQTDKGFFVESGVKDISKVLTILDDLDIRIKRKFVLNNLATFLKENDMLPAICFVFSRKNVEKCAVDITANLLEDDSKVPYIMRRECDQIVRRLSNYQEYLELPEYNSLVSLLEKGIGIHHSGMIPILREIVELMISKKYIKLLFATESFSIGLDCPIRTAIFTNLKKYDGKQERFLYPHEYTQAAGRAGRRGIDTIGHVVHCNNLFPLPTMSEYKTILCGKPQTLVSKFRIDYSMILRLIQNGQTTDLHLFAEKSMLQHEIDKQTKAQLHTINTLQVTMEKKRSGLAFLHSPISVCSSYMDAKERLLKTVNKKRRDCEREIRTIQESYKCIETDSKYVNDYDKLVVDYKNEQLHLKNTQLFIVSQTKKVCSVLLENGFAITTNDGKSVTNSIPTPSVYPCSHDDAIIYSATMLGQIAAHIREVHPLILAKCMVDWNYFDRFSVVQIVSFLSVFSDVRIHEDIRIHDPRFSDSFISFRIQELRDHYMRFSNIETTREIYTGLNYDGALMYDLVDSMPEWCECENEEQCKYFLQNRIVGEKEISIGDFTKTCLKISAISKELSVICEKIGFIDLLSKLAKVDGMILKYIATTQSLYL